MMKTLNKGFSLIELMVALTISLIVAAALTQVYAGTRQTNRVQEMQSRLTEDGRFAISMLQRVISQAGFHPAVNGVFDTTRIVATSGTSITVKFTGDNANIVDCDGAVVSNTTTATSLVITTTATSTAAGNLKCGTSDWVAPATGGKGTEVVDFQIKYGYDNAFSPSILTDNYLCGTGTPKTRDCVADAFATTLPTGVTADQVVAAKVCLVLRTEATDSSITKGTVDNCSGTAITSSDTDHKLYRTFQTTILLKNR